MTQIDISGAMIQIDAEVLAKAFRLDTGDLRQLMRDGTITSRVERGEGEDTGKVRLTFFSAARRVRMTADESGNVLTSSAVDFARPAMKDTKTRDLPDEANSTPPSRFDTLLDVALQGTFPASDPIAVSFDRPKQTGNN